MPLQGEPLVESLHSDKPRHRQIFEQLHQAIVSGQYGTGDKLPTEAQLMRRFAVSRTTVTRAIRDLQSEGVLERRQGSGTYVRGGAPSSRSLDLCFFTPFVPSGTALPHVEGLVHQHLASLVGQSHSRLVLQCLSQGEPSREARFRDAVRAIIESRVRGVLYYPAYLPSEEMALNQMVVDMLAEADLPVVLIDREVDTVPHRSPLTRIGYDNHRGGFLLADHLARVGCRRIAFIGSPWIATSIEDRWAGVCAGLLRHGIRPDPEMLLRPEAITASFCKTLINDVQPDAVVCFADRIAALVGQHLCGAGMRIGRDIRLAGFDDDPIAALLPVPLTTIALPARPFAEAAHQALVQQIQDPSLPPRQILIDCQLIVRASTSPDTQSE